MPLYWCTIALFLCLKLTNLFWYLKWSTYEGVTFFEEVVLSEEELLSMRVGRLIGLQVNKEIIGESLVNL
jgi:hypothetical protein